MKIIGITVLEMQLTSNLLVSKFHIGLIKELQVLMVIFITNIFLISYLIDLEDLFDFENIYYERKVGLVCINLVSMTYVGGNDYNLIESNKVKTKFVHDQR